MSLGLSHYRFGIVEGTEATHGWLAGIDRHCNRIPGANGAFLLRLCVQETVGQAENNVGLQVQYEHTPIATGIPSAWANVTTTSVVIRTGANAVFGNNANTTHRRELLNFHKP